MKKMFCDLSSIETEADVEMFFVPRLLQYLDYPDNAILPKRSLSTLTVGGMRGIQQRDYKPDFALKKNRRTRWILEAKAPTENLDNHVWQPKGYCMLINGEYPRDENPTEFFMLTNARKTRVYRWDRNECELELDFNDFQENSPKLQKLMRLLSWNNISAQDSADGTSNATFQMTKEDLPTINSIFSWCHQNIYKKDNISQSEAFSEFVKLISLKLLSDKKIKEKYPEIAFERSINVDQKDVKFSSNWLSQHASDIPNPMSDIQFKAFVLEMEQQIGMGKRKRFFDSNEVINLKQETISGVVQKLEHVYLFGIDADLNGRLFETFLNATMRGKDLGQFFTPRSLVKLGVLLANIKVHVRLSDGTYHTDSIIDACCGTGGFLIDAFYYMTQKVEKKTNLSETEKKNLIDDISHNKIVGIDIGRAPNLSRVARLNMYLHGDGGTRIYNVDSLDKSIFSDSRDDSELLKEKQELSRIYEDKSTYFDVAITNPPFAKVYERNTESENKILNQYTVGFDENNNPKASVKSSIMFFERYYDLLKVGGRLISIIDDGLLSGRDYEDFRYFLRSKFLIKAVISLPGDAFQRSKARVKTSFIVLEKRNPDENPSQPPVFMYACKYVGNDDPSRQRTLPNDYEVQEKARKEIEEVINHYEQFQSGNGDPDYIVQPDRIQDRLDVKYCLYSQRRIAEEWGSKGYQVLRLGDLMMEKDYSDSDSVVITKDNNEFVIPIIVRYTGDVDVGDEVRASDTSYSILYRVHTDDVVISNIAASYGSIAVIPDRFNNCVVSSEYTVLRANSPYNPHVIKNILRTPVCLSEMLLASTGANRTRVQWQNLKNIQVVYPSEEIEAQIIESVTQVENLEKELRIRKDEAKRKLEEAYNLADEISQGILIAFKPPK